VSRTTDAGRLRDSTGKPLERMPDAIRPGTNAIIFNELGEVLLELRSDNGFWGLPGGAVDVGESVEQAVKREVMEETGLRIDIKRLVGVYSDPRHQAISAYPDGQIVQHVTTAFECTRDGGELSMSDESTDIGYFDARALPENTLAPHAQRIRDALANRDTPFLR
jgi:8-oxo-dGTP pyrophosphatase MutT (NUDIX family)